MSKPTLLIKPKICAECAIKFTPQRPFQRVCSSKCAFAQKKKKKTEKPTPKPKEVKEKALRHNDWINLLQIVFNAWVRERDKGRPCITCYVKYEGEYHAGHFFPVGLHPELRFNEDNCHLQCRNCNINLRGNFEDYCNRLHLRIGQERFDALKAARNIEFKLSIPEIKEKIAEYRNKTKTLKNAE